MAAANTSASGDRDPFSESRKLADAISRMNLSDLRRQVARASRLQEQLAKATRVIPTLPAAELPAVMPPDLMARILPDLSTALGQVAFDVPKVDLSALIMSASLRSSVQRLSVAAVFDLPPSTVRIARLMLETRVPTRQAMQDFAARLESTEEGRAAVDDAAEALQEQSPGLSKAMTRRLVVAYVYICLLRASHLADRGSCGGWNPAGRDWGQRGQSG